MLHAQCLEKQTSCRIYDFVLHCANCCVKYIADLFMGGTYVRCSSSGRHKVQGASWYFFAFSRDSPLKNICKNSFINVSEFSKQIVWNHLCSFQRLKGLFAALLNHSILKTLRRTKFRKVNQRCHDKAQELHITFWRLHSISFCFSFFDNLSFREKNKGLLCFLSLNSSWRTVLLVVWKRNE